VFDDRSFSTISFDERSWLFDAIQQVTRFLVRLSSGITKQILLRSRL